MSYFKHYQMPKIPPAPPVNLPDRANYYKVPRISPMPPRIPGLNFSKEEHDLRFMENMPSPQFEIFQGPGSSFHINIPPVSDNRENNIYLHLVMKLRKFHPNEISVKADMRMITIECRRKERTDDDGSWAAYYFVRRVPTPPRVDIKHMKAWMSNGVLNIRAPFLPRSYERGIPIPVDVHVPKTNSSPNHPRNKVRDPFIGMQGIPNHMMDPAMYLRNINKNLQPGWNINTQPSWSLGLDGNVQRDQQGPLFNPATASQLGPQQSRKGSQPINSERDNDSYSEKGPQKSHIPNSNSFIEDLSYEMLNLTTGGNEDEADGAVPADRKDD